MPELKLPWPEDVPPKPQLANDLPSWRARTKFADSFRNSAGFDGCDCCRPPRTRSKRLRGDDGVAILTCPRSVGEEELSDVGFVDTHCHLEMVLLDAARQAAVPSLEKSWKELGDSERTLWCTLRWDRAFWDGDPDRGDVRKLGENDDKRWAELTPEQQHAASSLGWCEERWDQRRWTQNVAPSTGWDDLTEAQTHQLQLLGMDNDWWAGRRRRPIRARGLYWGPGKRWEMKDVAYWKELDAEHRAAAIALGFVQTTWDMEGFHPLTTELSNLLFGPGLSACIAQGCDAASIPVVVELANSNEKVFASFGVHPKAIPAYSPELENTVLSAFGSCGAKAVAWGEIGLDYSHWKWGKHWKNLEVQQSAFERQLVLAVDRGLPIVIHSREAEDDTYRIMKQLVPRDHRIHMHCFMYSAECMDYLMSSWTNMYFGVAGAVIVGQEDNQLFEFCKRCPLERMLLETDAPHFSPPDDDNSCPGQVPLVAGAVARLKGCSTREVLRATRANCRAVYGI